jgi:hypothetical protein
MWVSFDSKQVNLMATKATGRNPSSILPGNSFTITLTALALIITLFAAEANSQNIQNTEGNTHSSISINSEIGPSSLGLSLRLMLTNYPARKGMDMPVILQYPSKVWQIQYTGAYERFDMPGVESTVTEGDMFTQFIDRNGNTVTFDAANNRWIDTLGCTVNLPQFDAIQAPQNVTYSVTGLNNTSINYVFKWRYLSDSEVIEELAAPNYKAADAAVDEILRRGVRMIPLLMKKQGDQRFFRGYLARTPHTATSVTVPFGDPKKDKKLLEKGELVTVEVAALYLITAIYYESLHIAQSPYLTDLSLPEIKRRQANKKNLIERAWKATGEWYQRLIASDLQTLRAAKDYPLKSADVGFW